MNQSSEERQPRETDVDAWLRACQAHSYEAYEAYAMSFPHGQYYDAAIERYRALKPFWNKDRFGEAPVVAQSSSGINANRALTAPAAATTRGRSPILPAIVVALIFLAMFWMIAWG